MLRRLREQFSFERFVGGALDCRMSKQVARAQRQRRNDLPSHSRFDAGCVDQIDILPLPQHAARRNEAARSKISRTDTDRDVSDCVVEAIEKDSSGDVQGVRRLPLDRDLTADQMLRVELRICLRYIIADAKWSVQFVQRWNSEARVDSTT